MLFSYSSFTSGFSYVAWVSVSICYRKIASLLVLAVIVLLSILTCVVPYGRDDQLGPLLDAEALKAAIDTGDTAWMMISATLVLFMTPGLAFFYGGMVRDSLAGHDVARSLNRLQLSRAYDVALAVGHAASLLVSWTEISLVLFLSCCSC